MKRTVMVAAVVLLAATPDAMWPQAGGVATQQLALAGLPPAPWARQDPAEALYRGAREALNRSELTRAAGLFQQIRERYPRSAYAPDAFYWEAFARHRIGGSEQLQTALSLLALQERNHPQAASRGDAAALATRIQGELARGGDADAAQRVAQDAVQAAQACPEGDEDMRTAALSALMEMDEARALPILRQILERRDPCSVALRKRAVFLVAEQKSDDVARILLDVARNDPDAGVRRDAVQWLSEVRAELALPALEEILRTSTDQQLIERALFALSEQDDPRASALLRAYATRADVSADVRAKAIFWLSQQPSAENARFLRQLFGQTQDRQIQERILFALSQMKGQQNADWLMQVALDAARPVDIRKKALFWANESGDVRAEDLGRLYDSVPDRAMKEQLIFVLSESDDAGAVDRLIHIARTERDRELRRRAIFWLGQTEDPRAAEVLLEILNQR